MFLSDVSNLGKWSRTIIKVSCDSCGIEKELEYKLYTRYGYSNGEYYCKKCKLKINNLEKYGVENIFQLESIKNKIKETNLEKYGVENPSQNENIKEKVLETKSKLDYEIINEKREKTCLEKYGVINVSKLESIKIKKEETCLSNNNVKYISQDEDFKSYIKEKNLLLYGNESYFKTDDFKNKSINTNISLYGVDNPSKNKTIKEKIKSSNIEIASERMFNNIKNLIDISHEKRILYINCDNCGIFEISYSLFYNRREMKTEICTNCNPIDKHQSGKEIMLFNYIKSIYHDEIIQNFRINRTEIDIYLPKLRIGFEFRPNKNFNLYTNIEVIRREWNMLNSDNKNVSLIENIK
jgi:hypothetical protein